MLNTNVSCKLVKNIPKDAEIQAEVARALQEDVGSGDITAALLPANLMVTATIISREPMLLCGSLWAQFAFINIDPLIQVEWLVNEGAWLDNPSRLCQIRGLARSILTAERTALNFLQTLSATATQTYHYVQALQGRSTRLLDTRKTIPGLRHAQKYAVALAGAMNHRMGLYDAFLIKENHIKACGSITKAIQAAKTIKHQALLEVEVETLEELMEALQAKPSRILLDNFTLPMMVEAVAMNQSYSCELEVSGGVSLSNIADIAATGVDYISVGALTKSIQAIDLSLLINDEECT